VIGKMTVAERVEATLFGDCRHRDGDFEAVAAEVLGVPQYEIDRMLRMERALDGEDSAADRESASE
jgi:hypothetical protein